MCVYVCMYVRKLDLSFFVNLENHCVDHDNLG